MHSIQLKNKRGKVIAAMQWERPEDLQNWAASMCDKSGFEFRNVDPEVPITLIAIEKPAPKLKLVASEVNAINNQSDIETSIMSVIENLQEEFELLMCRDFVNEKTLDDKKNQIAVLNEILKSFERIHEAEHELRKKLEGCLLVHGVPSFEINQWLNKKISVVENEVAYAYKKERFEWKGELIYEQGYRFKVPLLLGTTGFEEQKEVRKSDKPLIGLTSLLLSGLKFKNTISIKQAIQ